MKTAPLIACIFFPEKAPLTAIAEACLGFTPQIAVREPEAIFLDLSQSQALLSGLELDQELRALCTLFNAKPRLAFAETPARALALARFDLERAEELPLSAAQDFLSPFKFDPSLQAQTEALIAPLHQLGLRTLKELCALPLPGLGSRFGKELVWIVDHIQNPPALPWPRFAPPEVICEKISFDPYAEDQGIAHVAALTFYLKMLCDRLLMRLRGREKTLKTVELRFMLENKSTRAWTFHLPVAQSTTTGLLPILKEPLSFDLERVPLPEAIAAVVLTVLETGPGQGLQRDFFDAQAEHCESFEALLGRLIAKLGEECVFVAECVDRYLPEKAWQKSLQFTEKSGHHPPLLPAARPTRLLAQPQPLRHSKEVREQLSALQPERLAGEWWLDPALSGFKRDYYQVVTGSGQKLWIFLNAQREVFLHGYFD